MGKEQRRPLNFGTLVLLVLNYIVIAGLLLSYIGAFLNPRIFSLPQFFAIIYPVLLFVNLFFIVYWAFARRRFFLYSLLTILVGIGFIIRTFNFSQAKRYYPHQFSLITYNVRLFNVYKWNSNNYTLDAIYQFVQSKKPDILCFQEFLDNKKIHSFSRFSKIYPYYAISYSTNTYKVGEAIFSRFPIVNTGKLIYNNHIFAIFADVLYDYQKIRVINVHLRSVSFNYTDYNSLDSLKFNNSRFRSITEKLTKGYRCRAHEVKILSGLIDTTASAIVLCGDFNDTPVSYTYTRISRRLTDAFTVAGLGIGNTYNQIIPLLRIDYVFVSNAIHVLDYRRVMLDYSDHYPLYVELSKE